MSYYNYVNVEEREYRNLRRQAKESEKWKSRFEKERKKRKRDIEIVESIIKKVDSQLREEILNLNEELRSVDEEVLNTKLELNEKIDFLEENLNKRIDSLRDFTKNELEKQSKRINDIVTHLKQEKENKKSIAIEWLNNLNTQIDMIKKLNHQKFAKNELDTLLRQTELAKQNIENGVYEAAIASFQERFIEAAKLFNKVYLAQKEFEELQKIALEGIENLKVLIEAQKEVEFDISGEKIKVDVDYWSEGEINNISKIVADLEKKVLDEKTTTEELIEIIGEIENLKNTLKELPQKALDKLILEESRVDIANKSIDILEELGFELVEDTFDREDRRKSIFLKFDNEAEEEIVLVVSPNNNNNKMSIMFDVDSTNEKFKDLRLKKILEKLNSSGVEVNNFECADSRLPKDYIKNFKDFEKIKRGEVETKNI